MSSYGSRRRQAAPLSLIAIGAILLVGVIATQRAGTVASAKPSASNDGPASSGMASADTIAAPVASASRPGSSGAPHALPAGLEDRGWIAETGLQRWIAGSLGGRVLALPPDEI